MFLFGGCLGSCVWSLGHVGVRCKWSHLSKPVRSLGWWGRYRLVSVAECSFFCQMWTSWAFKTERTSSVGKCDLYLFRTCVDNNQLDLYYTWGTYDDRRCNLTFGTFILIIIFTIKLRKNLSKEKAFGIKRKKVKMLTLLCFIFAHWTRTLSHSCLVLWSRSRESDFLPW